MKHYIKFLLPVAAMLLTSCFKQDKVIDIPVSESGTGKLVINSLNTIGNKITADISKSVSIKGTTFEKSTIDNAQVKLYIDGQAIENLVYDPGQKIYVSTVAPQAGKVYSVDVSAPGFTAISAETKSPEIVPIVNVERIENVRTDADGMKWDEIHIRFNDPAAEGNLYVISFNKKNDLRNFIAGDVFTYDPSVEQVLDRSSDFFDGDDDGTTSKAKAIFVRDDLFNGQQKDLVLYIKNATITSAIQSGDEPAITLLNTTLDYYNYCRSYVLAQEVNDNPFSEPVNVQTNVKNGYGIFTVAGMDSRKLQ